jgi:hypothetical protein
VKKLALSFACVLATALALHARTSRADDAPPVLVVYQQRLELAKLDVQKQVVQNDYDAQRLAALEDAYQDGAIPEATIMAWRNTVAQDQLTLKQLQSKVTLVTAELQVATAKFNAGESVPLCEQ